MVPKILRLAPLNGPVVILYLSSLILLVCAGLRFFSPFLSGRHSAWENYYTLAIEDSSQSERIASRVRDTGIEVVSPSNTYFFVSNFDGVETVALSDINDRLDSLDPRRDPFVEGLGRYFVANVKGEAWSLLYVRQQAPRFVTRSRIARAAYGKSGTWRLLDRRTDLSLFSIVLFLALGSIFIIWMKDSRLILSLSTISIIALYSTGDYLDFATGCFLLTGWSVFIGRFENVLERILNAGRLDFLRREIVRLSFFPAASLASALLLLLSKSKSPGAIVLLLLALISLLSCNGLQVAMAIRKRSRQEHRLFVPILLKLRSIDFFDRTTIRTKATVAFAVILISLLPLIASGRADEILPRPLSQPTFKAAIHSWSSLEGQSLRREENDLPDLSSYLAHRAFQDSFPVSGQFSFPQPNDRVELVHFTDREGRIVSQKITYIQFNQEWFDGVMSQAQVGGITSMLGRQSTQTGAREAPPDVLKTPTLIWRHLFLSLLLLSSWFNYRGKLTTTLIYGMRDLRLKRKRQVAL